MLNFLKSLFSFKGRIPRATYLASFVPLFLLLVSMIIMVSPDHSEIVKSIIMCIIGILWWWIWLAANIKRCHDLGWSGFTYFWFLLPIANFILLFMLIFWKGIEGPNKYGEPPQ
jgi:uncharacterized membrane protein YhaH (DUF805 family)